MKAILYVMVYEVCKKDLLVKEDLPHDEFTLALFQAWLGLNILLEYIDEEDEPLHKKLPMVLLFFSYFAFVLITAASH